MTMITVSADEMAACSRQPGWLDETDSDAVVVVVEPGTATTDLAPATAQWLRQMPVPVIGFDSSIPFDLVATSPEDAADLVSRITRQPHAAAVCCQVSRETPHQTIAAALRLESLAYATLQGGAEFRAWLAGRETYREASQTDDPVLVRRDADKLFIALNVPANRNALSTAMRDALTSALRLLAADDTIAEAVVEGIGPSFCAGGDLSEFGSNRDLALAHQVRTLRMPAAGFAAAADRVVCRVHGACIGAGIELPAFAKRLIAREDSVFQLPEVGMGLIPGAGGSVSIPRRIGAAAFNRLAIEGKKINAMSARRLGLVDEVIATNEWESVWKGH